MFLVHLVFIHQLGGLEKQGDEGLVSYDANNHQAMVTTRAKKIAGITRDYPKLVIEGHAHASILLVGWGSTYGSLRQALLQCQTEGLAVALLQLRHINPLPDDLGAILKSYEHVFVAELNSGQLCQVLRARFLVDATSISQCSGQPFTTSHLVNVIKTEVNHERENV